MSIPKLVKAIATSEFKDFESELARLNPSYKDSKELIHVCNALMYKNDLENMKVFINYLQENNFKISGVSELYMADSDQWEMLKLLHESKTCQNMDITRVFNSDNTSVITKVLEYNLMTPFALEMMILELCDNRSYKMYKKFIEMYPDRFSSERSKYILRHCYLHERTTEIFKAYVDLIDHDSDVYNIMIADINLEKYNILVQKSSKEVIVDELIHPLLDHDFNPDLIDILEIREKLQEIIDEYEVLLAENPQASFRTFNMDLLRHSGLNFKKHYLMKCMQRLKDNDFETVLKELPSDYYTDVEKSDIISRTSQFNQNKINILLASGWKVYDTPENRDVWEFQPILFDRLPKY